MCTKARNFLFNGARDKNKITSSIENFLCLISSLCVHPWMDDMNDGRGSQPKTSDSIGLYFTLLLPLSNGGVSFVLRWQWYNRWGGTRRSFVRSGRRRKKEAEKSRLTNAFLPTDPPKTIGHASLVEQGKAKIAFSERFSLIFSFHGISRQRRQRRLSPFLLLPTEIAFLMTKYIFLFVCVFVVASSFSFRFLFFLYILVSLFFFLASGNAE